MDEIVKTFNEMRQRVLQLTAEYEQAFIQYEKIRIEMMEKFKELKETQTNLELFMRNYIKIDEQKEEKEVDDEKYGD